MLAETAPGVNWPSARRAAGAPASGGRRGRDASIEEHEGRRWLKAWQRWTPPTPHRWAGEGRESPGSAWAARLGNLFREVEDEVAHAVVERAHDAGIRLFDTPLYGYGLSERRVGHVLRAKPCDSSVLATKVGRLLRADTPPDTSQSFQGEPFYKGTPPVNPLFDYSYDGVMRSLEESLERLGLDRIDVLHIHDPDDHYEAALAGAYRALDDLRSQGV
jgi:D-threo-aldose 1-dehydrogenase